MAAIRVDTEAQTLTAFGREVPCVIGKHGTIAAADKREGDGKTPLGTYAVRGLLLRRDRNAVPRTALPWRWVRQNDGWSDDARDPAYNRPVVHPHGFSAERLWRDDGLYDLIVVLGHNDAPPAKSMGSAIFLHCMDPSGKPTEGCVAVDKAVLTDLIAAMQRGHEIEVA